MVAVFAAKRAAQTKPIKPHLAYSAGALAAKVVKLPALPYAIDSLLCVGI
jgi:hypothetical protein